MNARIDQANQPDPGLERDARLEAKIDALLNRALSAVSTDRESKDAMTEAAVLMRRRSEPQCMNLEFQRRSLLRDIQ